MWQRVRRRRRLVILSGALIALICYADTHSEALLGDVRRLTEAQLRQFFPQRVTFRGIEGGIVRNIVLNDVTFSQEMAGATYEVRSKRVVLHYRFWDLITRRRLSTLRVVSWRMQVTPAMAREEQASSIGRSLGALASLQIGLMGRLVRIWSADGTVVLSDGSPFLTKIRGRMVASQDGLLFEEMTARLAGTPIALEGEVTWTEIPLAIALHLRIGTGAITGSASLIGPVTHPRLEGTIARPGQPAIRLSGDLAVGTETLALQGGLINETIPVEGAFAYATRRLALSIEQRRGSAVTMVADLSHVPQLHVTVQLTHLALDEFDLVSTVAASGIVERTHDTIRVRQGRMRTEGTVINFLPALGEVDGAFEVTDEGLVISRLQWGESYQAQGRVGLHASHPVEGELVLEGANLATLVPGRASPKVTGIVSGRVQMTGSLAELKLVGDLTMTQGTFGPLPYESCNLHLEGAWPTMQITDSRVYRQERYLVLEGALDLRRWAHPDFFRQVQLKADQSTIVWKGWDITKEAGSEPELTLGKNVGKDVRVNFKTYMQDEVQFQDQPQTKEVEVQYSLSPQERLRLQMREGEQYLGLERRWRF